MDAKGIKFRFQPGRWEGVTITFEPEPMLHVLARNSLTETQLPGKQKEEHHHVSIMMSLLGAHFAVETSVGISSQYILYQKQRWSTNPDLPKKHGSVLVTGNNSTNRAGAKCKAMLTSCLAGQSVSQSPMSNIFIYLFIYRAFQVEHHHPGAQNEKWDNSIIINIALITSSFCNLSNFCNSI